MCPIDQTLLDLHDVDHADILGRYLGDGIAKTQATDKHAFARPLGTASSPSRRSVEVSLLSMAKTPLMINSSVLGPSPNRRLRTTSPRGPACRATV